MTNTRNETATRTPIPPPLAPPESPRTAHYPPSQILVLSPQHGGYISYPASPSMLAAYGMMYAPVMTPHTAMVPPRVLFRRESALLPDPPIPVSPHPLLTPVAFKHRQKLAAQQYVAAMNAACAATADSSMPPFSPAHSSRQSEHGTPPAPPPSPASTK